ncbi:hypothetical protein NHH03_00165 [Stieleria sp. TO1_6]|uniref:hypothetical protein n=1 Tax=Stieleria tagensis TaxID=2956795 RepID=UPI00209A6C12|nr:hypothetical protein [Stieleria tagensis]MCO8120133.1 hypothetical protein [Stieleria tagensis]
MNFLDRLSVWLASSFSDSDTAAIRGYSFNLVENAGQFTVELIGAPTFDESDSDWACDEMFVGSPRSIPIPEAVHEGKWESCQENMSTILRDFLEFGDETARILKRADAVAVGFVDGELAVVYRAEPIRI